MIRKNLRCLAILGIALVNANIESDAVEKISKKQEGFSNRVDVDAKSGAFVCYRCADDDFKVARLPSDGDKRLFSSIPNSILTATYMQSWLILRVLLPPFELLLQARQIREFNDKHGGRRFLVQGDILIPRDEASNRHKRQAQRRNASNENLWVHGVKYVFDRKTSQKLRDGFKLAVDAWQKDTCINFTYVASEEEVKDQDYLYVTYDEDDRKGCYSHVGKLGKDQPIALGDGCESFPHAAHEVGHALGLYHTQNRHDRDKHIQLNMDQIKEEKLEKQFVLLTEEENENYELPYDYGSIMHYGSPIKDAHFTPTDDKYKTTMGSPLISFIDLLMINKHYNCTDNCDPKTSAKCENGGFPHPRRCNECICPGGYGGTLCNKLPGDCEQGEEVEASGEWETLNAHVYKNNDDGSYITCTYWITAPEDKKIEIEIESLHTKEPTIGCAKEGVEIKANANHTLTGYRYCVTPRENVKILSHSNRVPVILYTGLPVFWTTVELSYRAV